MNSAASIEAQFDPSWYLRQYPDVAAEGISPLEHWRKFGAGEGRGINAAHPGTFQTNEPSVAASFSGPGDAARGAARFDPAYYLATNPDVAKSGVDPLQHYLQSGYAEGRGMNGGQGSNPQPAGMPPMLNPNDPNSWAGWQMQAHAQTAGLNKMPYMAPQTSQLLGMNPADVLSMFYPGKAAAAPPASTMSPDDLAAVSAQAVANLGMGRR